MTGGEAEAVGGSLPRVDLARVAGVAAFVLGLVAYMQVNGLPRQGYQVVVILWLATVAWDVRRPVREHLADVMRRKGLAAGAEAEKQLPVEVKSILPPPRGAAHPSPGSVRYAGRKAPAADPRPGPSIGERR